MAVKKYKQKTKKAVKKRFKITANGKVKHRTAGTSHLATRKDQKTKRNRRGTDVLDEAETPRILQMLPNG
ncbi:50S ribosomal protein L35 [Thermopirellula anaerolimosa]